MGAFEDRERMITAIVHGAPAHWADIVERSLRAERPWNAYLVVSDIDEVAGAVWFDEPEEAVRFSAEIDAREGDYSDVVAVRMLAHLPATLLSAAAVAGLDWGTLLRQ